MDRARTHTTKIATLSVNFVVDDDTGMTPTTSAPSSGAPPPLPWPLSPSPDDGHDGVPPTPHLLPRTTNPPPRFLQPPLVIFIVVFQQRRRRIDDANAIGRRHRRIDAAAADATQQRWWSYPGGDLIKQNLRCYEG